jgi:hypothetical protein
MTKVDEAIEASPLKCIREQQRTAALKSEHGLAGLTDPDSRSVHSNGRTLQGYNAQAAATTAQVVVAPNSPNRPTTSNSWPRCLLPSAPP